MSMDFSRSRFLVATGLGVGAAVMLDRAVAQAETIVPGDLDALNAAIELERAGIKAYTDAAGTGLLTGHVAHVASLFRNDHSAHLAALIATVQASGATPSDKTAHVDYPKLANEKDILLFAKTVEELAASTYLSVIPDLRDRKLAQTVGSILGVETTHVAVLAIALEDFPPYPDGFVK